MSKKHPSSSTTPITFGIWIILSFLFLEGCQMINEGISSDSTAYSNHSSNNEEKQKGAHVFGHIDSTNYHFLDSNHVEWITLVSWCFQEGHDSPNVSHHNGDTLMIRKHDESWIRRIDKLQAFGFKIFVKPHIWMNTPANEKWRSDIYTDGEDWETWSESYREFILRYARISEAANAEMFCVGTEMTRLTIERPEFWRALIRDVRKVYSGKITYAANWYKEYDNIEFWDALDYIGIQAYFPLTKMKNPSKEEIRKGWDKYMPKMESLHKKFNRSVIFTEMGYKSTASSAIKPWEWVEDSSNEEQVLSYETQTHCYEAFFEKVWTQQWFQGVHLWQMRADYKEIDSDQNDRDFTPLKKPAIAIIAKGFE